jgi:two-component system invasion response regulator UvrY
MLVQPKYLLQKILQRQADAKVLVCSMYDSAQLVQRAFDSGAKGFVSKNAEPEELVRAVQAVFRGLQYLSQGLHTETSSGEFPLESERIASLSTREYEIFRLLALNLKGRWTPGPSDSLGWLFSRTLTTA